MATPGYESVAVTTPGQGCAITLVVTLPSRRKEFLGNLRIALGPAGRRLRGEQNLDRVSLCSLVDSVIFHACLLSLVLLFHGVHQDTPVMVEDKLPEATLIYYSAQSLPVVHDAGGRASGPRGAAGGRAAFHPKQTIHVVRDLAITPAVVDVPRIVLPRVAVNTANLLALSAAHASKPVLSAPPPQPRQNRPSLGAPAPVELENLKSKIAKTDAPSETKPANDALRFRPQRTKMADLSPLLAETAVKSAVVLAPRPRPVLPKEMVTESANSPTPQLQMVPLKPVPVVEEANVRNDGGETTGTRRELVVSARPGDVIGVPAEGKAGSLALSPKGGTQPGTGSDLHGDGVARGAGPGSGASGDRSGAGNTGSGPGSNSAAKGGASPASGPSGAGAGGSSAIPGVDIRGGVVTLDSFGPRAVSGANPSVRPRKAAPITIVATSRSGGGLAAYGVFKDRTVYTVYLDTTAGQAVLQFAARDGAMASPSDLTPPDPLATDTPGGVGAGVVFACLLDASGHVQNLRAISSVPPSPALEDAVRKWIFHPVLNGGQPVDVDALIGIGVGVQ